MEGNRLGTSLRGYSNLSVSPRLLRKRMLFRRIGLLVVTWAATFVGGQVLGAATAPLVYDPYYYCAAKSDSCSGLGWVYVGSFTGTCCCDLDHDDNWSYCTATLDVYLLLPDLNFRCYRLNGGWQDTEESCSPGPVSPTPIEALPWGDCGCTLAPQEVAEPSTTASVVSPN